MQPPGPAVLPDVWVKASEGGRGCLGNAVENAMCICNTPGGRQPRVPRGPCEHSQKLSLWPASGDLSSLAQHSLAATS